jgi:hypothetical protein
MLIVQAKAVYARPNCTHVIMDAVHLPVECDICHQPSTMGWLYECQQDRLQAVVASRIKSTVPPNPVDSPLIRELQALRFSGSVIQQAADGLYTDAQVNLLKAQKAKVNKLLEETCRQPDVRTSDDDRLMEALHPNITVRRRKGSKKGIFPGPISRIHATAKCNLRCCHVRCPGCHILSNATRPAAHTTEIAYSPRSTASPTTSMPPTQTPSSWE